MPYVSHTADDIKEMLDEVEMLTLLVDGLVHADDRHHCAASFDGVAGQFSDDLTDLALAPIEPLGVADRITKGERIDDHGASREKMPSGVAA